MRRTHAAHLVCVTLFVVPLHAQPIETLSPQDIAAAIDWGTHGDPAPYPLYLRRADWWVKQNAGRPRKDIGGLVYTPFVRVALAAKAAHDAGLPFTPDDIPPGTTDPVVYVGFRWLRCIDPEHASDPSRCNPTGPFDYKIATPRDYWTRRELSVTFPRWINRDVTSVLAKFSAQPPYGDIVLIAAYPVSALSAGRNFVIYRPHARTEDPEIMKGWTYLVNEVRPEDPADWR